MNILYSNDNSLTQDDISDTFALVQRQEKNIQDVDHTLRAVQNSNVIHYCLHYHMHHQHSLL